ncbi:MAG: hypothetical protein HY513_03300 [Candidatus Aenigmarchaeota archaeon]|nr:hypothetical protein [Candidatus Aenigmarchaeota archaeon]
MSNLSDYVIQGRLGEDGQEMDFPALRSDVYVSWFKARAHVFTYKGRHSDEQKTNLVYYALPRNGRSVVRTGPLDITIPFKVEGKVTGFRTYKSGVHEIETEGVCLVKIHPGVPHSVRMVDGALYHSFEMLQTPDSYYDLPMKNDFVQLPDGEKQKLGKEAAKSDWVQMERGDRLIKFPGGLLFPDFCAYRLPGWLAGPFNGSPKFMFAYGEMREPRKGELLHRHTNVMEPYIGLSGTARLFVGVPEGSDTYSATNQKSSLPTIYPGEVLELKQGDVLLPMPGIPHRFLFDNRTKYPFENYTINYAERGMDTVPADDRVVLEG